MRPVVLCFSGLDPSGGAGLQADIEAIASCGAHAAVVATALTIQDSQQVYGFELVSPDLMRQQAEKVLADLPVAVIKLGMLGSAQAVQTIFAVLSAHPHIPVVIDPVLAANSGGELAYASLRESILAVLPQITVLTPNSVEARRLSGCNELNAAVETLAQAPYLWLKGGHEPGTQITNTLFKGGQRVHESVQTRLAGEYHGSGCTLASALAAFIALGHDMTTACQLAEKYTYFTLQNADLPHPNGQRIPRRIIKSSLS
ncbi:MAG: hydroxymethylpyrimidine/phosphomethylpyrimidine kinase [Moraxellaceae bacterium]|nr:hydroxymethylpyrimidine/phosphomethylpyrimidine kinase [Moraxellaceae bacterium]